jgi:capsular polysaccharide biosynthesis protein
MSAITHIKLLVSRHFRQAVRIGRTVQFAVIRLRLKMVNLLRPFLSANARQLLPRRVCSVEQFQSEVALKCKAAISVISAPHPVERNLIPRSIHAKAYVGFLEHAHTETSPVYFVHGGPFHFYIGQRYGLVTADGDLVQELSFDIWGVFLHHLFRRFTAPPVISFDGLVCAIIESEAATYGHWLLEMVPRLVHAQRHSHSFGDAPKFLISHHGKPHELETLAAVGISEADLLSYREDVFLKALRWIIPSQTSRSGLNITRESTDLIRGVFLEANRTPGPRKRLYLSRRNDRFRRITNEDEVISLLERYGFEAVEPGLLTIREQAHLFAAAEAVVSVISSGLANIVFMTEGNSVIEIFPDDFFLPIQWALSDLRRLRYYYFFASGYQPPSAVPPNRFSDVKISLPALRETLAFAGLAER